MSCDRPLGLLLLWMPALLCAADAPPVEARIKLISTTRQIAGVGIVQDKKIHPVVIPAEMFSEEIHYRGPARLELTELTTLPKPADNRPTEKPETKAPDVAKRPLGGVKTRASTHDYVSAGKPPFAWIDLPANLGRLNLILLVTPGKGNGIVALHDVPGAFPPGSNRYLNLCAHPVVVRTPQGDQTVPPGGTKISRPGARNRSYYELQLLTDGSNGSRLLFSSRILHLESVRKLYLLMPVEGDDGRVSVRDIEDRPPSAPETDSSGPDRLHGAK